jgi:hypothetical protein
VIALGSHAELGTQSDLASRLAYITGHDQIGLEALHAEVGRLTQGLLNALRIPDP